MKGSILGMAGVRGSFGITPKAGSASLPLRSLLPQVLAMLVTFAVLVVNSMWCAYNLFLLSTTFYFNNSEEQRIDVGRI